MGAQIANYFASGIGQLVAFLPNLLSAIVILVAGYAVSRLLATGVRRLLARANFDRFVANRLHPRASQSRRPASGTLGSAVFWLGMLITISLTAQALKLGVLAAGINQILGYVPRVIVAALIVGIAIAVANVLSDLASDVTSSWVARGIRVAVIGLSIFMALDQLGIARSIVTTTYVAVVGAAAVAAAIAFGVGNIDLARDYSHRVERRRKFGEQESTSFKGREPMAPSGHPHDPGQPSQH